MDPGFRPRPFLTAFLCLGLACQVQAGASASWGRALQTTWPALRQGPQGTLVSRLGALRLDFSNPASSQRGLRVLEPVVRELQARHLTPESFQGLAEPARAQLLESALRAHEETIEEETGKALRRAKAWAVAPQHVDSAHDLLIDGHPFMEKARRAELLAALPELRRKREVFERWNRSRLWAQAVARRLLEDMPAETSEAPAWSQGAAENDGDIPESPEDPLESRRSCINAISAHIRAVSFYLLPKLEEDSSREAKRAQRLKRARETLQGLSVAIKDASRLDSGRLWELWRKLMHVLSWYKDYADRDAELEAAESNTRKESADEFLVVLEDLIRIAGEEPPAPFAGPF